jgi:hypothetical protein
MGSFNVILKKSYLYFKIYLRDEFENAYIHEDLNNVDAIIPRLVNTTVETLLTLTKIASGRTNNA